MGIFRRKKPPVEPEANVFVHLNARVRPLDRGSVYEDPLDEAFARIAPGSQVVGGGTEFHPEKGPLSCDSDLAVVGDTEDAVPQVIEALESFGAPVGSWLTIKDGPKVPFGITHGFALTLDGTSLPDEVYAENDVNDLVNDLVAELEGHATLQSWWAGPQNTSLYFYGVDPDRLRSVLESAASRSPLAQGSRVEMITD
ncbi:hypothetical protein OH146_07660 [Salinibacterium sp. SYSU T00001]|uniref:hypothetical protein n=1 Tax=Homoserinimonas sedimenticola TaxID=2986805 RepID=UPI0022362FBB|nr:hypothetical protein [Salinibacterium sedimenticola]MCW4385649.1 hypothetical protein [Salinibacterium sedimenticola]